MVQRSTTRRRVLAVLLFLAGIGVTSALAEVNDALFAAISSGSLDGVKNALVKGAKLDVQARPVDRGTAMSALQYAVSKSNTQIVAYLLTRKADPNARDATGWSVMDTAVEAGSLDVLRQLVDAGARLDPATPAAPRSVLHTAAYWNRPALARYLIGKGMGISAFGASNTPLDIAIEAGYGPVAAVLAPLAARSSGPGRGIDDYRVAFEKKNAAADIHWYAFIGDLAGLTRLVKTQGVSASLATPGGSTPLHFASTPEVARYLLSNGADPLARDSTGVTPLHAALSIEALDVARALVGAVPARGLSFPAGGPLFMTTDRDMAALIRQKGGLCVLSTPLSVMGMEENILHDEESLAATIGSDLHHVVAISSLEDKKQVRYVVNGAMGGVYQKVEAATSLCMGLDGSGTKWGLPLKDGKDNQEYVLREDGTRMGPFARLRAFSLSADGRRALVASSATRDDAELIITLKDQGRTGQSTTLSGVAADGVPAIGWSDNGAVWYALVEKSDNGQSAFVNGKEVATDISQFWLSPDGGSWAAVTGKWNEQYILFADGRKLGPYQYVSGLAWAPDSKSWIAVVSDSSKGGTVLTSSGDTYGPMKELDQSYNWILRYANDGKSWLVSNRSRLFADGALVEKEKTVADWIDMILYAPDGKSWIIVGTDPHNPAGSEYYLFTAAGAEFSGIDPVALTAVTVKDKSTSVRTLAWLSSINKVLFMNSLPIDALK